MQHTISIDHLGPYGPGMARAVETCVHCGFCLPTCPTYVVLGEEMDSPRGRIYLMKAALEGGLTSADAQPFVDRCLGCMACVTACPSGVRYEDLLTPYRARIDGPAGRPMAATLARWLARQTLPHPARFRAANRLAGLARPIMRLLPGPLRAMLSLAPRELPAARPLPAVVPAVGQRRARVALLAGCVQQVLAPEINWATVRVLAQNGVEVIVPAGQGCCGALHLHGGDLAGARRLARRNLRAFPLEVDAVITNAAGCGSGMKEYGHLFAGESEEDLARSFVGRVRDVAEFLDDLGLTAPAALSRPLTVAYHDACHLAHAQGIVDAPRRLLSQIRNVTIVAAAEHELCCGSAGTYNIEQPAIAETLGDRKAANLLDTGAQAVVMGNIGCMVQIERHLARRGRPLPVLHTVELIDRAYRGADG